MGPADIAALLMGPTEFFIATKTDARMVHKLMAIIVDTCLVWIDWRIRRFGGPMPVLDLGDDYAAYFGPDQFDEFIVRHTGAIIRAFPQAYIMFHSDGDFNYHNLAKVADLGIDMFNAFSPRLDIRRVRELLGPTVDLAGNVDPIRVMVNGAPADVLREARRCIEAAGRRGHFVLCPGGGVGAGTKLENVDALVEASLAYSGLMRDGSEPREDK